AATQMLIAGIILTLIGALNGEFSRLTYDTKGWAALGYLVVFGSIVGYSSYIYALAKLPTSIVSTYAYINPVIAVLLGWLVLDERLDWLVVLATIVILFGVVLVKIASQKNPAVAAVSNEDESEDLADEQNDLILDAT
ncbi:MAG: EamA family transporter, partial [bacterium]